MKLEGLIKGLQIEEDSKKNLQYHLKLGDSLFNLNELLGQELTFHFSGEIRCSFCEKIIKKTYGNGSCYPCFISLPQNDLCILKPDSCHFHKGSCRNSVWGEDNCFKAHSIYLSYTSNLKVGITREFRIKKRWLEQGATQAIKLARVQNRLQAGLVEVALKKFVSDTTNWRQLFQEQEIPKEFEQTSVKLKDHIKETFNFAHLEEEKSEKFNYPILQYPKIITPYNLEKTPCFQDKLIGLKGSYLLFEGGVFNIKKFTGFYLEMKKY